MKVMGKITTVKVATGMPYEVSVGAGAVRLLPGFLAAQFPRMRKIALVADSNVAALHSAAVSALLAETGREICGFVFPAGERSKHLGTYGELLAFLAGNRFSRADIVVALGGGVTGDLAGFSAATYMRGIDFVQLPTSLLAMVDSSVGGKTAVNLDAGKNLAGAFHQPRAVFCDTGFLSTLPEEWLRDGMGEVFKYAVLGDETLFAQLEADPRATADTAAIVRCIAMKRDIVNADERENGMRKLLNLGHTFAHAIEKLSGYSVSHGRAVATGVVLASRAAGRRGLLADSPRLRIESLARAMGYGTECEFAAAEMAQAMLADKKASAGAVDFVLPLAVGRCSVVPVPAELVAGMAGGVA